MGDGAYRECVRLVSHFVVRVSEDSVKIGLQGGRGSVRVTVGGRGSWCVLLGLSGVC